MSRGSGGRRAWLLGGAVLLALAGSLAPAAARPADAAGDALLVSTSATYTIVPAKHLVRVAIDLTATNNKPDSTAGGITTRYFYVSARIAIQTQGRNVRATAGGSSLATTVAPRDGYSIVEVTFRNGLFYRQTTKARVTFDLPGGAPRSASPVRVGSAFATFVAWAFGDIGSVQVVVPAGFAAEATGSSLGRSTSGSSTVLSATSIRDVGNWYAVVNADRPAGLTSDRIDLPGGEHLVVRAWPEDAIWRHEVAGVLTRGLPELARLVGLAWPVPGDLQVFEVHTPLLEGYAGVFIPTSDRIEISEDLDELTIVHEVSHSWFNAALFDGRWINEGLANTYASRTLEAIGSPSAAPGAVSPTDPAAVPLADWTTPGRITDAATNARETYGYNASWTVIRSLLAEVGVERMQAVFQAAHDHRIAYVGALPAETVAGVTGWQQFLDLLDETAGSKTADDLFRRWVVGPAALPQFDARASARTAYAELVQAGQGWLPPASVRVPMSRWDFEQAQQQITAASAVLTTRDAIDAIVAPIGLVAPADLRSDYETSSDGLAAAQSRANAELAAARALAMADAEIHAPRDVLTSIGLIGQSPDADLAATRSAFEAGSADTAGRAQALTAMIGGAGAIGQARVAFGLAVVLVLVLLIVTSAVVARRRRRTSRRVAWAWAQGAAKDDATGSYATLPDQSTGTGPSPERPPADPPPDPSTEPSTEGSGGGPERGTAP